MRVAVDVLVENLGRYRIEKELGRGAMGQVFLAYDPQIERRVAIKTIQVLAALPEADRRQARDRFLREARSAGKLLHPGIVTIFDVGEASGVPYIAMEYVEGTTLDAFCRGETLLPVAVVVELLASAAEALAFAHGQGIVHRDVKPANLMRVGETRVKIMDFGLAKSATAQMTHDGALLGTPNYMSPEQVRGQPLDGRSDLFSLGVVLYEMLTGEKPFGGDTVSSVLYRIVHEAPREPEIRLDRVPPALATFLGTALAKDAQDRFQDGGGFAQALRKAGQEATSAQPARTPPGAPLPTPSEPAASRARPQAKRPPARPAPAARPPRRSLVPYVIVAALAVAGAAGGWIFLQGRTGTPRAALVSSRVRTEPPGLPVKVDGQPLSGAAVEFSASGPFPLVSASQGCRVAEHRLDAGDAGREVVLVLDPEHAQVSVNPGAAGAAVNLNGKSAGAPPIQVDLDLCRENLLSAAAPGYGSASVKIPAGATPLAARNAAAGLRLQKLPTGRLVLPRTRADVRFFVDGEPASRTADGIELPVGRHEVRAVNDEHFVEVTATVDVPEGEAVTPALSIPPLARLVVQSFPPNASVFLKKGGSDWRPVGETPLRMEVQTGRYAIRIRSPLDDETREEEIDLKAGANAPVRVAFGRGGQ